jgi:zinc finger protein
LRLETGTLGGRFTTIEGLLTQVYEELDEKSPFRRGDSVDETRKKAFESFLGKLKTVE